MITEIISLFIASYFVNGCANVTKMKSLTKKNRMEQETH
jgi:hypothetical protein